LPQLVAEARNYEKLRGTFVEGFILNGHIQGRVHCQFHPLRSAGDDEGDSGTVSGRYSSTHPNLQQIPVRTELGKELRAMFIPEEGRDWWCKDYSQIEFRLMLHFACKAKAPGAEAARQQYQRDPKTDFHQMAAALTGKPRDEAKGINLGLMYNMGLGKLAVSLGLANPDGSPSEKALQLMEDYHTKLPFIKAVSQLATQTAQKRGYVKTILGRRAHFDNWEPRHGELHQPSYPKQQALAIYGDDIRRADTYKALNRIVQGSSADQIKTAMVRIWESGLIYDEGPLDLEITLHDELDGDSDPGAKGQEALAEVKNIMESAIPLLVPVYADGKTGKNWREAK